MLAVVAVFVPSFFMTGVARSLFVPLSLAVGFAMIASFLLSSSLVPVLSVRLLGAHRAPREDERHAGDWVERLRTRLAAFLHGLAPWRVPLVIAYAVVTIGVTVVVGLALGREIFPAAGAHQFQLRFAPRRGRSSRRTEQITRDVLGGNRRGRRDPGNVDITLGYVGVQPSAYPVNTIFLWTGGSHEGRAAGRAQARRAH